MADPFKPKVVAFLCNWCSYTASDLAGTARIKYSPHARIIRVMCSGRVDPQFVLSAFREGADGVLVLACHPGDCHYKEGNYRALQRSAILSLLLDLGRRGLNRPAEIEFAVRLSRAAGTPHEFAFLQIRPLVFAERFAVQVDVAGVVDAVKAQAHDLALHGGRHVERFAVDPVALGEPFAGAALHIYIRAGSKSCVNGVGDHVTRNCAIDPGACCGG